MAGKNPGLALGANADYWRSSWWCVEEISFVHCVTAISRGPSQFFCKLLSAPHGPWYGAYITLVDYSSSFAPK